MGPEPLPSLLSLSRLVRASCWPSQARSIIRCLRGESTLYPPMDLTAPFIDAAGWQEIVQFRKLKLPSSESYDGSAERPARRLWPHPPTP